MFSTPSGSNGMLFGGNDGDRSGCMWIIAIRFNNETRRRFSGYVTVRRHRWVKKVTPLPLT